MNTAALNQDPVALAQELIRRRSVTPDDQGCQELIAKILEPLGFAVTDLSGERGDPPVLNTFYRLGDQAPLLLFAGHTDVVPPGPSDTWRSDPFGPVIEDGYLYGRGASDMKGSVAAMAYALSCVAKEFQKSQPGSVALLLTSDEEGPAIDGTRLALERLKAMGVNIDQCLVGEPTSSKVFGDTLKVGRRGSLSGQLTIEGKQGHIAYPHLAKNPIHALLDGSLAPLLEPLDDGVENFDPSSLQFSATQAGVAGNVIPGTVTLKFNIRFNTAHSESSLRDEVERRLKKTSLNWRVEWQPNPSEPFLSKKHDLAAATAKIVGKALGTSPVSSTSGGTSDARFISRYCDDLVEFGPVNDTIHQANERVGVREVEQLAAIYTDLAKSHLERAASE